MIIWGAFFGATKAPLVFIEVRITASDFISAIYETALLPFVDHLAQAPYIQGRHQITLMEDGTPIHTARRSNEWCAANFIIMMPWPARSPDLNPIENLFKKMKSPVIKHYKPQTMDDLQVAITAA
ncbi:hypothetical protein O181_049810 [Austropuccinia psidii MF-1]|uniref:Tc1-like transposase DDE domain-containing protein n=1 Tax=Austropuccinia psidii MF-1 TaxID=1389203 RepID=A0A9Q3DZX2_9BASI|nr:hypothetical protein [Austropuccinia psidii MF-1]